MRDREKIPNVFKGPLGIHINYINYIALPNFIEYDRLKKRNRESNRPRKTPALYEEFRYYLNAIESFNNILDYYFYEYENDLKQTDVIKFRKTVLGKYDKLKAVSDIANAYKHCVRTIGGKKRSDLLWSGDIQKPQINIVISKKISVDYSFEWPIPEYERVLEQAWKFWVEYINHPESVDEFKAV